MSDYCSEGNKYNPKAQFCYDGRAYSLCGGSEYDPASYGCVAGAMLQRCGQNFFHSDEFCYTDSASGVQRIYKKCNGAFDPNEGTCDGEPINPICGGAPYHPDVDFCFNNKLEPKCGGITGYDPETQFCFTYNNRVYDLCNGRTYNPITEPCGDGEIDPRPVCGETRYNDSTHFCFESVVYKRCGEERLIYDPIRSDCDWELTGGDSVVTPPDDPPITPPDSIVDSRDGQIYKTVEIGEQVWMAENLNYNVPGEESWCYDDDPANCGTYGRLYTWDAAMAACPAGWKLPTSADWTTLENFVGSSTAGTRLKAGPPDWDGTDNHGFSALPSGHRFTDAFRYLGSSGYWWTATERVAGGAYAREINAGDEGLYGYGYLYEEYGYGFSVRCLRD
jgi:uncharacterized protein (TIGR02145 family)